MGSYHHTCYSGGIIMARVVNYEQKIEGLKAKIEKKTEELKKNT